MSDRIDPSPTCTCTVPVPVERAERKGASRRHCLRCERPLPLKLGTPPRRAA